MTRDATDLRTWADVVVIGAGPVGGTWCAHDGHIDPVTSPARLPAVHDGVLPNITQLTRLLHLEHQWDDRQQYFAPQTQADGRSSLLMDARYHSSKVQLERSAAADSPERYTHTCNINRTVR